jgi:uncharacterized repeat protein (TIGR01451 family)
MEVQFLSASNVVGKLYDSDGVTLLNSLSYSNVTGLPGGVAMRSFSTFSIDTIAAVNNSMVSISPPTSGTFSNGSWTGNLTVLQPASNVVLYADDGSGHQGSSSPFNVGVSNDVSITTLDSPHPVSVGAALTYTLTLANTGPSAATGVTVTNFLPSGVTFVSAISSQGTCTQNAGIVTCNLGTLPGLGSSNATVTIVVTPIIAGVTLSNTATVSRAEVDGYAGNNTAITLTPVTTPAISIADASAVLPSSGTTNMTFALTLASPSAQTITVSYATSNNTAIAGNDYVATNGIVTFPPGITNGILSVSIIGSIAVAPNKTFFVNLSSPVNGVLGRSQAVGTIVNSNGLPGQIYRFAWSAIPPTQFVNTPFGVTIQALDYSNNPATTFNGTVNLSGTNTAAGGFQADFETGLQGFTVNNGIGLSNGLWHVSTGRGSQAGHSASHSIYYGFGEGPAGGGTYNTTNSSGVAIANEGVITSPTIDLRGASGAPTLSFNYLIQTEPSAAYDNASVEISTNGGISFIIIAGNNQGAIRFTNNTSGLFTNISISLSNYVGFQILLRFHFNTVDSAVNNFEGWYIDDIVISGTGASGSIAVSPTTTDNFTNGLWAGSVAVGAPGTNVSLRADDAIGHTGSALPSPPSLSTTSPPRCSIRPAQSISGPISPIQSASPTQVPLMQRE